MTLQKKKDIIVRCLHSCVLQARAKRLLTEKGTEFQQATPHPYVQKILPKEPEMLSSYKNTRKGTAAEAG